MGFFEHFFNKKITVYTPQQLEDLYKVELTDTVIKVTHPKRADEEIRWEEIEEVRFVNTDEGPFRPDVWMILSGNSKSCSIPQGSKGWDAVYDIVSKYQGFNFENAMKSATCAENQVFEIWKK